MKVRIEVDKKIEENEVVIRCSELSEEIENIKIMFDDWRQNKNVDYLHRRPTYKQKY